MAVAAVRPAHALDPSKAFSQYALTSWTQQQGLDAKSVMAIAQTNDGFLWLATEQGLVRYDGVTFVTFDERNAPGLGDRLIHSLAADPDGSLWIGTQSGLVRYHDGHFQDLRRESLNPTDIYDLCPDGQGGIFSSSDHGLYYLSHGSTRIYTTADGLPSDRIGGLTRGTDGSVWVGTSNALVRFKDGKFTTYGQWSSFRGNALNAIAPGARGTMWIGMFNGTVGRWADGRITTWLDGAKTGGKRIESLHEDRDGTLWLSIRKLGLGRLRGSNLQILSAADGLPSNSPDWIFDDRENNLWIGWADAGLSMLRDTKFTTFGKREGLSSDKTSSVAVARDGGLWIGTADAGLDHLQHGAVKTLDRADGLAQDEVLGVLEQRDGTLWVGSETGEITRILNGHRSVLRVSSTLSPGIPAIIEDHAGEVWFAIDMKKGLARLRDGRLAPVPLWGVPHALAFAPDGSLWVASYLEGLVHLRKGATGDDEKRVYTEKDGLPSLELTSVYVDPSGAVWAGTTLAGMARWKDGRITTYSAEQGLFDNAVGGIIEDDYGYLWMAGTRGIWRIPMRELNDYAEGRMASVHSQAYGYSNGLRSTETSFNAQPAIAKSADGRLWFATGDGLSTIDPGHILTNRAAPRVLLEKVTFDGRARTVSPSAGERMDLPPGDGSLEVAFTAPSFIVPRKIRFRYRLAGSGDDWVDAGPSRTASFQHLRPGRYRFEVQAANSDGLWSAETAALDLRLAAHYYQTWWFWTLASACLVLTLWSAYTARVRYYKRKTRELEEIVAQRTTELRQALDVAESAKERLYEQATKDSLTGLWNRRAIFEIFERDLKWCREAHVPYSVIMVDADRFKSINDTHGHVTGDFVIQTIGQRLTAGLRLNEAVGRYGGEEILILLPRCPVDAAVKRAEQLRRTIEETPFVFDGKSLAVTCSFGVGQLGRARTTEEIIEEADQGLYIAKKSGRNCVRAGASETATLMTSGAVQLV